MELTIFALGFLLFSRSVASLRPTPTSIKHDLNTRSCEATWHWPSWQGISHAFFFGDSYTSNSFDTNGSWPYPGNAFGNPSWPGRTSSNWANYVGYLTWIYNSSLVYAYDLAYEGATVDSTYVAPNNPEVSTFAEQVEDEFLPVFGSRPEGAEWHTDSTIFSVFFGINDVNLSFGKGANITDSLNEDIIARYGGLVDELYNAGGRNFLFLNVPPVDRAPGRLKDSTSIQEEETVDIAQYNELLAGMVKDFKLSHGAANVFLYDTNSLFSAVLDDMKLYPQTSNISDTTTYCEAYEDVNTQDYYNETCGVPVNQYFWLNSLHPTYMIHEIIAEEVSALLRSGPNIC